MIDRRSHVTVFATAALSLLAAVGATCSSHAAEPQREAEEEAASEARADKARASRTPGYDDEANARAALLTIYYLAYSKDPRVLRGKSTPRRPTLETLVPSLQTLKADTSSRGNTRRRRAIAVLTGRFAEKETKKGRVQWRPREVELALKTVLRAPIEKINAAIDKLPHADRDDKETAVYAVLNAEPGDWKGRCCACLLGYNIEVPRGGVGMGFFSISVNRQFADVRRAMEPRRWATCNADYFASSYTVANNSCSTGDTTESPNPAGPGEPWSGELFEHFRLSLPPTSSCNPNETSLRNILEIHADGDSSKYRVDFGLSCSMNSSVQCQPHNDGIERDCGFTSAVKPSSAGPISLNGVKYLKFSSQMQLDDWLEPGLRAMIDDVWQEGVCCDSEMAVGECKCPGADELTGTSPKAPKCPP